MTLVHGGRLKRRRRRRRYGFCCQANIQILLSLLLLLNWSPPPDGMHIVERWCYTYFTKAKDKLDSVTILLNTLRCTRYRCPSPGVFHFKPLIYSSSPSLSAFAAAASVSLASSRSITACYHQHIPNRAPSFLFVASQSSRNYHVEMYSATMFCLFRMYVSIVSNSASAPTASSEVYY